MLDFALQNFLLWIYKRKYKIFLYKSRDPKCWILYCKISFYKFIKENLKFHFITGINDFIAGVIWHPNLYYISQENFSLSKPRTTHFVKGSINLFYIFIFIYFIILFYIFIKIKMWLRNAEFWTPKISFYKFIKENSKFPFIISYGHKMLNCAENFLL